MANKNVPQLAVTAVTAGSYFEITIPNGLGDWLSKKIPFSTLKDAFNAENTNNKGYFTTEAALIAAYPVGENGWFSIVGATDTVWTWDGDTEAWIDTEQGGMVISVNGLTGAVTLAGSDIEYDGLAGLVASELSGAIDEVIGMLASYLHKTDDLISQAEAEAGVNPNAKSWSALRVKQAIEAVVTELESGLTADELDAIQGANAPSALNPMATMDDISVGGNGYETHVKATDKSASYTILMTAGSVLKYINIQRVSGAPIIKVGTTLAGDDIIPETTVINGGLSNTLIQPINICFEAVTTLYITISGGMVNINYITYEGHFTV